MLHVLFAIEIVLAIAMVGVILLQRSEGGALGMGGPGGGAGFGGFLSARGASNLLTRTTAILAFAFITVALLLAIVAGNKGDSPSVFDQPAGQGAATTEQDQPNGDDLSAPLSLDEKEEGDTLDTPPPSDDDNGGEDQ